MVSGGHWTWFPRYYPSVAAAERSVRTALVFHFPMLAIILAVFATPWVRAATGVPVGWLAACFGLQLTYEGINLLTPAYDRHPVALTTYAATVNLVSAAAAPLLAQRFHSVLWVFYFLAMITMARAFPVALTFVAAALVVPIAGAFAWHFLRGVPLGDVLGPHVLVGLAAATTYAYVGSADRSERQIRAQAEELTRREAEAMERRRIADDLHDTLGAALAEMRMWLGVARRAPPEEATRALARVERSAQHALGELRGAVQGLAGGEAGSELFTDLVRARVGGLCEAAGIALELESQGVSELPMAQGHHVVKIVEEAVANAVRHARPRVVRVGLTWRPGLPPRVEVTDDGAGFPRGGSALERGNGLRSMRSRAAALGGALIIDGVPGGGTRIVVDRVGRAPDGAGSPVA